MDKVSNSKPRKILIVSGEGIECEKEAFRFFQTPTLGLTPSYLPVPRLLTEGVDAFLGDLQAGDWIFFPGGFSFADHFGSGRLLAFELRRIDFFERALKKGLHLMGICNGFQVLTQAGLFGEKVELLENRNREGSPIGFRNQWIKGLTSNLLGPPEKFRLCVRHGEGRLSGLKFAKKEVSPLLYYDQGSENQFFNGSEEEIAGLIAVYGVSKVIGMMPHPEVSMRAVDDPDFSGPEFMVESRGRAFERRGDGVRLMERILKFSEGKQHA